DHQGTLWTIGHLAVTYGNLGELHKAVALEIVVLDKRGNCWVKTIPTLWVMGNLALTYGKLGWFLQAEELEAGAVEKYRKLLGEDHPDTIRIMRNLVLTYCSLDKVPEAEELE
ncbi:hypothetical protein B0H13DRAFT_1489953, partial [Mycena leptocephala]